MNKTIYVIAFAILFLTAFKDEKKQDESNKIYIEEIKNHHNDGHGSMVNNLSENTTKAASIQNQSSTSEIIDAYLQLKNALTEDNEKKAAEAGNAILTAFSNFNISQLTEVQHHLFKKLIHRAI
jgi:uncharacterized membrane protein YvbJ